MSQLLKRLAIAIGAGLASAFAVSGPRAAKPGLGLSEAEKAAPVPPIRAGGDAGKQGIPADDVLYLDPLFDRLEAIERHLELASRNRPAPVDTRETDLSEVFREIARLREALPGLVAAALQVQVPSGRLAGIERAVRENAATSVALRDRLAQAESSRPELPREDLEATVLPIVTTAVTTAVSERFDRLETVLRQQGASIGALAARTDERIAQSDLARAELRQHLVEAETRFADPGRVHPHLQPEALDATVRSVVTAAVSERFGRLETALHDQASSLGTLAARTDERIAQSDLARAELRQHLAETEARFTGAVKTQAHLHPEALEATVRSVVTAAVSERFGRLEMALRDQASSLGALAASTDERIAQSDLSRAELRQHLAEAEARFTGAVKTHAHLQPEALEATVRSVVASAVSERFGSLETALHDQSSSFGALAARTDERLAQSDLARAELRRQLVEAEARLTDAVQTPPHLQPEALEASVRSVVTAVVSERFDQLEKAFHDQSSSLETLAAKTDERAAQADISRAELQQQVTAIQARFQPEALHASVRSLVTETVSGHLDPFDSAFQEQISSLRNLAARTNERAAQADLTREEFRQQLVETEARLQAQARIQPEAWESNIRDIATTVIAERFDRLETTIQENVASIGTLKTRADEQDTNMQRLVAVLTRVVEQSGLANAAAPKVPQTTASFEAHLNAALAAAASGDGGIAAPRLVTEAEEPVRRPRFPMSRIL